NLSTSSPSSLVLSRYRVRTMAAKSKKKILKTVSVVDISCGNCIKPTFSSIFNFFSKKPKRPSSNYRHCHSSVSSATPSSTPLATAAVAVEKDSDDPYLDFRQSMLQMILENQIYSKDELRELLQCFLSLNSHYHHGIIVRAFSEIWEDVSSAAASAVEASSPLVTRHVSRASRDYYNYY
ncbi:unnamed protein product, partial [Arabidopsis halleri]